MGQVLNAYQFWLDELFPKAKFADGLSIIEALGHKKTMQVIRTVWIDEERIDDQNHNAPTSDDKHGDAVSSPTNERNGAEHLDAQGRTRSEDPHDKRGDPVTSEDQEIGADLDDLMALTASHTHSPFAMARINPVVGCGERSADLFADDEEAMADIDW